MTARKNALGSDLRKVDAHEITPEEYAEIPELTREWFAGAELHVGGVKVRRGRPRSSVRKQAVKLRIDPDTLAAYKATGPGWQTGMNYDLRKMAPKAGKPGRIAMRKKAARAKKAAAARRLRA
jgi:uncharacterized protein (DUF4415 family)